jgi:hypothetical protein
MRLVVIGLLLASLGGCSLWLPRPDPDQAWIDLHPTPQARLKAKRVDEREWTDERYFQVKPGRHALSVRYQFEVSASNLGWEDDSFARNCRLSLEYSDFAAGERYRLVSGHYGFRPWIKLYDQHDQELARGQERGCGGV